MDQAQLIRRFPWSQYKDPAKPQFMTREEDTAFAKANWPFTVRWNVPDGTRGLYGWRCESRAFATEEAALAAAKAPMGIARDVRVLRWNWDVAHNHPERAVTIYTRKNAAAAKRRAASNAASP